MVLRGNSSGARRNTGSQVNPVAELPRLTLRNRLEALLVDSDMTYQAINSGLLTYFGVETQVASSGMEAMEMVRSGGTNFDIVIVELVMPEMNGRDVTKRIRRMGFQSTILGISADNRARQTLEFLAVGGDEFMEKPLNYLRLAEILIELDDKKTAGRSTRATGGN